MIEDSAKLGALAARLLAHEGGGDGDPTRLTDAADRVCRKLRDRLAPIIGQGGFGAILDHAVQLTRVEFPFLGVDLDPADSTCLRGLTEAARGQDTVPLKAALIALLANFLITLVGLIGGDLSRAFLRSAWPEIDID